MADAEVYELATPRPLLDPRDPLAIARRFVAGRFTAKDQATLWHWRGDYRAWRDGAYREITDNELRHQLYDFLDSADRPGKDNKTAPFKPTSRAVSEIGDALKAATFLDNTMDPPSWIELFPDAPDPASLLSTANGILNLDTYQLEPHAPELFVTSALPLSVNLEAPEPESWLAFLRSIWADDNQAIGVLQEIFGYALTTDTDQQKIFLMVGPKRSGKGTIARVLTAMLGRDNVTNPTFASLATNFGLAPLIDRRLAIIGDARLSARSDQATLAERLLSISGEDGQSIDRKFRDPWHGRLQTRFLIITNELPRISDSSGALASRFVLLTMTRSFLGQEDHALTDRLLTELPGIMNWSLEGLRRLRARGYFQQPKSSSEALREFEDLASPINAFIRDCCIIKPGVEVLCVSVFKAWKLWCEDQGRSKPGTKQMFGRDLRAAMPSLKVINRRQPDGKRQRYYEGFGVTTPEGYQ